MAMDIFFDDARPITRLTLLPQHKHLLVKAALASFNFSTPLPSHGRTSLWGSKQFSQLKFCTRALRCAVAFAVIGRWTSVVHVCTFRRFITASTPYMGVEWWCSPTVGHPRYDTNIELPIRLLTPLWLVCSPPGRLVREIRSHSVRKVRKVAGGSRLVAADKLASNAFAPSCAPNCV